MTHRLLNSFGWASCLPDHFLLCTIHLTSIYLVINLTNIIEAPVITRCTVGFSTDTVNSVPIPMSWFAWETSPIGSCVRTVGPRFIWSTTGGTAWGGYRTFRRRSLAGGNLSLGTGLSSSLSASCFCCHGISFLPRWIQPYAKLSPFFLVAFGHGILSR